MKSIIIFGGAGYIGKNLIRRFAKEGYKIIVPYQKQTKEANLRLLGAVGQIIPFHLLILLYIIYVVSEALNIYQNRKIYDHNKVILSLLVVVLMMIWFVFN